jgi:23S rRNA (cytidine1920-2'-O)/16S rRNA (cytidine1409-2'-O)-methyltransferase
MADKVRLDKLLVERGFFDSREKAQEAIEKGFIIIPGKAILKPSTLIEKYTPIQIKEELKYVSRGGYKLEKALDYWEIDVSGLDCLDVGSSTGGFVDCLLQRGAKRVIALDVGRSLLHPKLSRDKRVIILEGINARYLNPQDLPFLPDFVTCDVSFISIKKIFPALHECFKPSTEAVFLLKPQFEAERKFVRKGIVRDQQVHQKILKAYKEFFEDYGFYVDIVVSPITGAKGNIEYLCYLTRERAILTKAESIDKIVAAAFRELKKSK